MVMLQCGKSEVKTNVNMIHIAEDELHMWILRW